MTKKKSSLFSEKTIYAFAEAANLILFAGEAAFPKILKIGTELTRADFGSIYIYEKDSQTLKLLATESGSINTGLPPREFPIDNRSIESLTILRKVSYRVNDVLMYPNYYMSYENVRSELAVPLIVQDRTMGVLDFQSTKTNNFTDEHLKLIEVLASFFAIALRNAEVERRSSDSEAIYLKSKKPLVFILMPLRDPFDKYYRSIIKPAIEEAGMLALRADEIFGPTEIVKDIWKAINKAQFVVAELTTRNPNVMYELGLCHAIGKHVIMLSQSIDDIPFDLRSLRCILYDTVEPEWADLLRRKLIKSIEVTTSDEVSNEVFLLIK